MLIAVVSGFGLALGAPWLHRVSRVWSGWLLALLPAGLLVYFIGYLPVIAAGQIVQAQMAWAPALDLALAWRLDGLSLLFAILITGIGALILIYAGAYLDDDRQAGRLYAWLLIFMGAMLGMVLADNLLALYVFWEVTSISSYLLIGYHHNDPRARAAALQALLITSSGGLALLAGLVLLGLSANSWSITALLTQRAAIQSSPLYLPALLLILLGAFTKSAQVPFHFWLPNAMEAPTPVSAYLHSATMVKAGVYLLARLQPIMGGTPVWWWLVGGGGLLTMLVGGLAALYQHDLKRVLAYSTVSALGLLTALAGLGDATAAKALVVFLLAHACYKGALFMLAGAIDHATGTRDLRALRGLGARWPGLAALAVAAGLGLAGFGPVLSFVGKELALEAVLHHPRLSPWLSAVVTAGSALFMTAALLAVARPFWGRPSQAVQHAHALVPGLWLGAALLAALVVVLGAAPGLITPLVAPAATAIAGTPVAVELALWHGVTPALLLSLAGVGAGLGLYLALPFIRRATWLARLLERWPGQLYTLSLAGLLALARAQTAVLQNGRLRAYLRVSIITTIALAGTALARQMDWRPALVPGPVLLHELVLALVILGAALAAVVAPSRLSAVAALGVVGAGISLIYVLYSAPDLAMTQVLVEMLTVMLFVFVFYHLPRFGPPSPRRSRLMDAAIALGLGSMITSLILATALTPPASAVTPFYLANSKALAHGSNIVNVILVDFRGLDTLGEITVLSVAALGVYALLRLRPREDDRP